MRIKLGLPNPRAETLDAFNHNVITRPLLQMPDVEEHGNNRITIMTYNLLAQSLIRRELFPSSGKRSHYLPVDKKEKHLNGKTDRECSPTN